jgi:hypothetical protein
MESVTSVLMNYLLPYLILGFLALVFVEFIAAVGELRGKHLKKSIVRCIGDAATTQLYQSSLISPLGTPALPAYIPAKLFAFVLVRLKDPETDKLYIDEVEAIKELDAHRQRGESPRETKSRAVAEWFDTVMVASTSRYRQHTHFRLFALALLMVVAIDLDPSLVASRGEQRASPRDVYEICKDVAVAAVAQNPQALQNRGDHRFAPLAEQLEDCERLALTDELHPGLGWSKYYPPSSSPGYDMFLVQKIVGWLVGAVAIALSAPLLFDLLARIGVPVRIPQKPISAGVALRAKGDAAGDDSPSAHRGG